MKCWISIGSNWIIFDPAGRGHNWIGKVNYLEKVETQKRDIAIATGRPERPPRRIPKWKPKWRPKELPKWPLWRDLKRPKRFVFLMFPHETVSGRDPKRAPKRDPKRGPKRSQEWSQKGGRSWNWIERNDCCETMKCEIGRFGDLAGQHCFKSAGVANNWIENIIVMKLINANLRFISFK